MRRFMFVMLIMVVPATKIVIIHINLFHAEKNYYLHFKVLNKKGCELFALSKNIQTTTNYFRDSGLLVFNFLIHNDVIRLEVPDVLF